MNVKILVALVSIVSLGWLGLSFAISSDEGIATAILPVTEEQIVDAEHPHSHRLGELLIEEVALPAWDKAEVGAELALIAD